MKTPPPEKPFDPDDPNVDPWADDPNAPKEPGYSDRPDDDIPWSEDDFDDDDDDSGEYEFPPDGDDEDEPTPTPEPTVPPPGVLGPVALFDSQLRGEIEFEILYQQTKAALQKTVPEPRADLPARVVQGSVLVLLTIWGGVAHGLAGAAAVLAAKFLHELGHLIGQWLFGYRERELVNLAFPTRWLPRGGDAGSARRAVVFLLGPLPGLAMAFGLQAWAAPALDGVLQFFILILLAFNLAELWIAPACDGARFFERVPLLRGPWPTTLAHALGVGLLAASAAALPGTMLPLLVGLLAALVALGAVRAWRLAKTRQALTNIFEDLPERATDIPDDRLRTMLHVVLTLGPDSFEPADLARAMHIVHERVARPAIATPMALSLVATYLFGWLLAIACAGFVVANVERHRAARDALVAAFQATVAADPADRPRLAADCAAAWRAAHPSVRREALRMLDSRLAEPPEPPQSVREFANSLKSDAPPHE
ncbi:MAG: hypothetical protein KF873_07810 [Gemmataceae bacterium]|nr:hypothetical protein [Planctomycetia bacterium]MBX3398628.1 hypothetical protein [Gemmataceae bacterium]